MLVCCGVFYYSTACVQGVLPPTASRPPFVIESNAPISVGFAHLGEADFVGKTSLPCLPCLLPVNKSCCQPRVHSRRYIALL